MKHTLIIIYVLLNLVVKAQDITIKGNEPSYANQELVFYTYKDLITYSVDTLAVVNVESNGKFEFSVKSRGVLQIHVKLGVYNALMYAEPNHKYEIVLPPKLLKSKADSLNPFFEEELVQIGIKNGNKLELNYLINKFNREYFKTFFANKLEGGSVEDQISSKFYTLYLEGNNSNVDSLIKVLNKNYDTIDNQYFINYKKYQLAALKNMVNERSIKVAIKKYFKNQPVLYNNVSYMKFFNGLFEDYFYFFSKTPEGRRIIEDIHVSKSVYAIKHTLSNCISLYKSDDDLLDLIILKGIYDAYSYKTNHTSGFKKPQLNQTLDSLEILTTNLDYKKISENIRFEWNNFRVGSSVPNFNLLSSDTSSSSLDSFRGKFVYLTFMYTEQTPSIDQAKFMSNIYDKNKDKAEFVSVIMDKDIEKMYKFKNDNKFKWTFLHNDKKQSLIEKYKIVTYPTFFFISPEGKLLIKNAPSPTENFESYLFEAIKAEEKKQWGAKQKK